MTRDDLADLGEDLYREHLLDHYMRPRQKGELKPADLVYDGDNPTCGDRVRVTARLDKAERIEQIRFEGTGCAISQAAASMLYEDAVGKSLREILAMERPDVEELLGITLRPARVKCGVLGLNTLKHAIHEARKPRARGRP